VVRLKYVALHPDLFNDCMFPNLGGKSFDVENDAGKLMHSLCVCVCASLFKPGLPDFSWCGIHKMRKKYRITIKYVNWPQTVPNGRKIDQMV
jgi:hypothetical protein